MKNVIIKNKAAKLTTNDFISKIGIKADQKTGNTIAKDLLTYYNCIAVMEIDSIEFRELKEKEINNKDKADKYNIDRQYSYHITPYVSKLKDTKVTVNHSKGFFSFIIPFQAIECLEFFESFMDTPPVETTRVNQAIGLELIESIILDKLDIENILKATKHVTKDKWDIYRGPHFANVILQDNFIFSSDKIQLFKAKLSDKLNGTYFLPVDFAKKIANQKEPVIISFYKKDINTFLVECISDKSNIYCDIDTSGISKIPTFLNVIPAENKYLNFKRDEMISEIKRLLPFSPKSNSRMSFDFIGCDCIIRAWDVDYASEAKGMVICSTGDLKIGFNATLLLNVLSSLPKKSKIQMSYSSNGKAVIFCDQNNTEIQVLLFPCIILE